MVAHSVICFSQHSQTPLRFSGDRVSSEVREELSLPRVQVVAILQRALWEVFASSSDCSEGTVRGEVYLEGASAEFRVGDCRMSAMYDATNDIVTLARREAFTLSCFEFAWITRAMIEWTEGKQPDGR